MFTTLLAICIVVVVIALIAMVMHKTAPPAHPAEPERVQLQHSINRTLCVGCEMCVVRCPVDVLALDQEHKAKVVNKAACISCRLCEEVCPTPVKALRMYRPDATPPNIQMPMLDGYYQAVGTPGLYVVGEVAGKPLIKNGINLGLAAVEHIVSKRRAAEAPDPATESVLDVVIIGAGPTGLSAGMACHGNDLRYVVLEREASAMATVMSYPKGKAVHAAPPQLDALGALWLPDKQCTKEELCKSWNDKINEVELKVETEVEVVKVQAKGDLFHLETNRGTTLLARYVIVAIGGRGALPMLKLPSDRTQDVPGQSLPHIHRAPPEDPAQCRSQKIIVFGGGNTAIEVAVALARPELENKVFLSYYRPEAFLKANRANLAAYRTAVKEARILPFYEANPLSFRPGTTTMQLADRVRDVETDQAFILIGYDNAARWLKEVGVQFSSQRHDEFNLPDSAALVRSLLDRRPRVPQPTVVANLSAKPPAAARRTALHTSLSGQDTVLHTQRRSNEQTDPPSSEPQFKTAEQHMVTVLDDGKDRDATYESAHRSTPASAKAAGAARRAGQTIRIPRDTQLRLMPDRASLEEALRNLPTKITADKAAT